MSWWKIWERGASESGAEPAPHVPPKPQLPADVSPVGVQASAREPATAQGPGGVPVVGRPRVFDPALKQFPVALVPQDPRFDTPEELRAYRQLQLRVMGHALRAIAESRCAEHLVLRGSALMCAWFGEAARPPKDLDFVVVPESLGIHDSRAVALLEDIVTAVTSCACPGVELGREEVARDDIWTYDRVPGNRLVFRWTAKGMPWGATQLDFVFGERLPVAAESLSVQLDAGPPARLQTAPQSLSLAWKLLWLYLDWYPRGKDLYDAMLLAEATTLPGPLLDAVFELAGEAPASDRLHEVFGDEFTRAPVRELEWVGFEKPDGATIEQWRARLSAALRRDLTFSEGIRE